MEKNHLYKFNFDTFVRYALKSNDKKDVIENYGNAYESLEDTLLEDTSFYKDYLSKFDTSNLNLIVPEGLEDSFDYDLFVRLVAASLSSEYTLSLDESWNENHNMSADSPLTNISIYVVIDKGRIHKDLKELCSFQIYRMYEIYLLEQIQHALNLAEYKLLECEDDEDDEPFYVETERLLRIKRFSERKSLLLKEAEWFHSIYTST